MKVKPKAERLMNYKTGAGNAGPRYTAGVNRAEWKTPSLDGQELYVTQMQNTEVLSRREKGINKVTDEQWRTDAIKKGSNIISGRMIDAADKQANAFEPYAAVLEGITLAPKTADPATNVTNRVIPIAVALHNKKISG